jgi:hypothetical protein
MPDRNEQRVIISVLIALAAAAFVIASESVRLASAF